MIFMINVIYWSVIGASNVPLLSTSELLKGISDIPHFVMFYKDENKVTFGSGVNRLVMSSNRNRGWINLYI